jgi:hypothetical protein
MTSKLTTDARVYSWIGLALLHGTNTKEKQGLTVMAKQVVIL